METTTMHSRIILRGNAGVCPVFADMWVHVVPGDKPVYVFDVYEARSRTVGYNGKGKKVIRVQPNWKRKIETIETYSRDISVFDIPRRIDPYDEDLFYSYTE